jgi:hypothetical protein
MTVRLARRVGPAGKIYGNDLLEYRKEDPDLQILPDHKMSVAEVRTEIQPEGFTFDRAIPQLPRQHIIVFREPAQ